MKVLKNYLYNVSYQILNIILPIITVPYVTRIFTSEDLGTYSFYYSILSYFVLVANLGINIYGTKEIAASKDVNRTFWNIYAVQGITSLTSLIFYIIALFFIPSMNNKVATVLTLGLITRVIDISWLFNGLEDFKKVTLRNAIVKLIGVSCILLFIKSSNQLVLYVFFLVIFDLCGQLVLWVPARKLIKKPSFDVKSIKNNLQPSVMLFLPQVAISLYAIVDRTMLGFFRSFAEVGIFDQGQKIISILITLVTSLGIVMLPRVSSLLSNDQKEEATNMMRLSFLLYNLLIFPTIFGIFAINDIFVKMFFGEGFQDSKYVIYIMIIKLWSVGWSNIIGYQVLVTRNRNKEFLLSTTIPAICSMLLNLLLIPLLGFIGSAITSALVDFLVLVIQIYYAKDIVSKSTLFNTILLKIVVSSIVMYGVVILLRGVSSLSGIVGFTVYSLLGVVVYLVMIFILNVTTISEIRNLLK